MEQESGKRLRVKADPTAARAVICMKQFFQNKKWWCGGPIPKAALLTRKHIDMVVNMELVEAVDRGYAAMASMKHLARTPKRKDYDTKLCLSVLDECHRLGIPQQFEAGLFLLYLKLCEKVEL